MLKSFLLLGFLISIFPMFIFGQSRDKKPESTEKSAAFSVKGMSCPGCVAHVEGALKKVDGVKDYQVSLSDARADVTYDPAMTDEARLEAALAATGYQVAPLQEEPAAAPQKQEEKDSHK